MSDARHESVLKATSPKANPMPYFFGLRYPPRHNETIRWILKNQCSRCYGAKGVNKWSASSDEQDAFKTGSQYKVPPERPCGEQCGGLGAQSPQVNWSDTRN